jgi:hypothetical protein
MLHTASIKPEASIADSLGPPMLQSGLAHPSGMCWSTATWTAVIFTTTRLSTVVACMLIQVVTSAELRRHGCTQTKTEVRGIGVHHAPSRCTAGLDEHAYFSTL